MVDMNCPWCEATLPVALDAEIDDQTCPECQTSWSYVESTEIALAA